MTKNQIRGLVVLGIVFIAYSVIAFAIPLTKGGLFWLSYIFTIIAIAVQIYVFCIAFPKNSSPKSKFYGFPLAWISVIYLLVQIVLSVIFILMQNIMPIWAGVIIYTLLLAVAAIGFISADVVHDEMERHEATTKANVTFIYTLRAKVSSLAEQCEEIDAKRAIKELSEKLQYSDPVSNDTLKETEDELNICIAQLQDAVVDGDSEAIIQLCCQAGIRLSERNRLCKLNK